MAPLKLRVDLRDFKFPTSGPISIPALPVVQNVRTALQIRDNSVSGSKHFIPKIKGGTVGLHGVLCMHAARASGTRFRQNLGAFWI
jgi:hypothetical protein